MPGAPGINGSQPFKLKIEDFRTNNAGNNGVRANVPAALANAQPAAAPQPAVAQARQQKKGFFAWIASWFSRAEPAPAPAPRHAAPPVPEHKKFNNTILDALKGDSPDRLGQNFKEALSTLENSLREKFGPDIFPEDINICKLLSSSKHPESLDNRVKAANDAGRELTPGDIVQEYTERADYMLNARVVGQKFLAMCKDANVQPGGTANSQGIMALKCFPEIGKEFSACKTQAEMAQVLEKHSGKLAGLVQTRKELNEALDTVKPSITGRIADAMGMNKFLASSIIHTQRVDSKLDKLAGEIMAGTAPGCKDPGFDVKAALTEVVDDFVNERTSYLDEIDTLNIDESVKQRWKASVLNADSLPAMRPAKLLAVAGAIDTGKLEGALDSGLPLRLRCAIFCDMSKSLENAIKAAVGDEAYLKLGSDEKVFFTSIAEDIALASKPGLRNKIHEAEGMLKENVMPELSKTYQTDASTLVSSLVGISTPTAQNPLAAQMRLAEAVGKQIDAALAEGGFTDAKIIADVKAAFVERGNTVLKSAESLAALSQFVDSVKEQALDAAKALESVAKTRATAKNVAATTIAASTGLGKGFVSNNLDTSTIASDSGKLRFLYMDVVADVKNGNKVDFPAVANKASKIVGDFAFAKAAVLKSIDEAGFEPADRAYYLKTALREGSFKDAGVVSLARELAGNASVKKVFNSLAEMLKPQNAATLDAKGIGAGFQVFAKAFSKEILANHPDAAAKMADSSDMQHLVQMMTVSLLAKDHPEIPERLAKLAESGTLAEVENSLSASMNEVRTAKMDYMTLEQYNLMGPPANEPIRAVLSNPGLQFDKAKYDRCVEDFSTLNVANTFLGIMTSDFPTKTAFTGVEQYTARKLTGGEMVKKYSEGLAPEAVPVLDRLVSRLDWRPASAENSEKIVKGFVEDLKAWRDIEPGSPDANGLENVLLRRMNEYLTDTLGPSSKKKFNDAGVFETFIQDLPRNKYVLNGSTVPKDTAPKMLEAFNKALGNDPAKLKAVSMMLNQQIFGELTTAVPNKTPLASWKPGQEDEEIANIPGVEKFVSRDINRSKYPLFGSGPMSFEINVAPDGNSAKIRAKSESPIIGDVTLMDKGQEVGKCILTQEFTLELGDKPAIKDLKIGQTLA